MLESIPQSATPAVDGVDLAIAEREIVPEYAPYAFGPGPIIRDASALLADSICWAMVKTSVSTGEPLCDDEAFARIVASAIKTMNRSVEAT